MLQSFRFYLYSLHYKECFDFQNDNGKIMNAVIHLIDYLPKFEGGNVRALLKKDNELIKALHHTLDYYIESYPRLRRIYSYFDKLEDGEMFFYQSERAPLSNHLVCLAELPFLDNPTMRRQVHDSFLMSWAPVIAKYEVYAYGYNGIRKEIGNKNNRICRFCGKREGETTFRKIAHAIPEALGNKLLFSNEECDLCNEQLASVEDNLTSYLDINRAICNIKGKGGCKDVEGENFVIRHKNGKVQLYIKGGNEESCDGGIILRHRKAMNDQGLYRALAKVAIDLMPTDKIKHFKETIAWINGLSTSKRLPKVIFGYSYPISQPVTFLFFNNREDNTPFCTCVLHICDRVFIYMIPFVDRDSNLDTTDQNLSKHWPQFEKLFPAKYELTDFSDEKIKFPYYTIDTSQVVQQRVDTSEVPSFDEVFKIHSRKNYSPYCEFPELPKPLFRLPPSLDIHHISFENQEKFKSTSHTMLSWKHGANIRLYPSEGKVMVDVLIELKNADRGFRFMEFFYTCTFLLSDFNTNMQLDDKSFSFDFRLRDRLWQDVLAMGELALEPKISKTVFNRLKITSLVTNSDFYPFITYMVFDDDQRLVFKCKDTDIHRIGMRRHKK